MEKVKNHLIETKKSLAEMIRRDEVNGRLKFAAAAERDPLFDKLQTTPEGLDEERVNASREQYCDNKVTHGKKVKLFGRICAAFVNPFTAILVGLAAVSCI